MGTVRLVLALAGIVVVTSFPAVAAAPQACGRFPSLAGKTLLAVDVATGKSATATIAAGNTCIPLPGASVKLYVKGGEHVEYAVVAAAKPKKPASVATTFKGAKAVKLGKLKVANGALLVAGDKSAWKKSAVKAPLIAAAALAATLGKRGQASAAEAARRAAAARVAAAGAEAEDGDGDGLVDAVDADNDGDGTLDNYDQDGNDKSGGGPGPAPAGAAKSFYVFSNLKIDIDQSLNVHTGGVTTAQIDAAMQSVQSLAIGVAGDPAKGETTELDCGTLAYCAGAASTGRSEGKPFPQEFDADGDGFGTLVKGATNDFQLVTGATSATIAGGDTFIQRVGAGGTETEVPGMLNFVFGTTPAIKSVTTGVATYDIDYAANPRRGSRNLCMEVPASGDVVVTITGWRPQRPGNAGAGEGTWVDIGRSKVTIDVPNGPVSTGPGPGPGPGAMGPGNCKPQSYTTTDPNLSVAGDGLQDAATDRAADSANTYTFTVDLTTCLGSTAWNPGETLFTDLQFRSEYGDNAAQKFCFTRRAS